MTIRPLRPARLLAAAVLVAAVGGLTPTASGAAGAAVADEEEAPAPITGVVRTPGGDPVPGVGVALWSGEPSCSICSPKPVGGAGATTGSDGRFTVTPPSWAYDMRLYFHPEVGGRYHQAVYPSGWFVTDGAYLDGGEDVVMTLSVGGTVSGTITTQGDVPSTRVRLVGTEEDEDGRIIVWTSQKRQPAAGPYEAGAVPAGTYTAEFCVDDNTGNGDFTSWCPSGNVVTAPGGAFAVTADQETTGKDVTLEGPDPAVLNTAVPTTTPSGTPRVGTKLSTSGGSWSPSTATRTYQWLANGAAISGATAKTYTVPPAMKGKRLSVRVRATAPGHTPTTRTSAQTPPVAAGVLAMRTAPRATGTLAVGKRLTASPGSWTPAPSRTTYQWLAGTTAIRGATGPRLTLTRAMRGKRISVRVTVSRAGYATRSVTAVRGTLR